MTEIWKTVDGFETYEISNLGNLRSKRRTIKNHGGTYVREPRLLVPKKDRKGYLCFIMSVDGRKHHVKIHRLVAQAFIPNPENKPEVNHIDNNPSNNNVENLEWCTHYENMMWMQKTGRAKRTEEWIQHLNEGLDFMRKEVEGTNILTGEKVRCKSVNGTKALGFTPGSVSRCCNGLAMTHRGYTWRFIA